MLLTDKVQESTSFLIENLVLFRQRKLSVDSVEEVLGLNEDLESFEKNNNHNTDPNKIIVLKNLSFKFGENVIFEKINFIMKKKQLLTIYGESGVGKSTFVNILLGHITNYTGKYYFDGLDTEFISKKYIRKEICCMQQERILFPESILFNITLGINFDKIKFNNIVIILGIDKIVEKYSDRWNFRIYNNNVLSGGEVQKILIARCLLSDSKVLIFDEPTSALDYESVNSFLKLISEEKKVRSIILLSHDKRVFDVSDRIININNKKMLEVKR